MAGMGSFSERMMEMVLQHKPYRDLQEACRAQIDIEAAAADGMKVTSAARASSMKRLVKKDSTSNDGTWMFEGKQYVCNGYAAVELFQRIAGLPEVTKVADVPPVFRYIDDTEKLVGEFEVDAAIMEVPARAEIAGKNLNPLGIIGTGTFVNARYLQDVIVSLGGYKTCKLILSGNPYHGVIVRSELGRGLIMAIKVKKQGE